MKKFFIGIDLGIENKKTSAICILEEKNGKVSLFQEWCDNCHDIFGKEVFKKLMFFLKKTKIIAIDSPLTKGKGKGKMRLFEKFFSRKIFRNEKINPIPPALIPKVCNFSLKLRKELEKEGFVLDINLIETSSRLVESFIKNSEIINNVGIRNLPCQSKNQKSAFFAAFISFLHSQFETRYIGYRDGFLFLPKISLWKSDWRKKIYIAWKEKPKLKYRYLITNLFER